MAIYHFSSQVISRSQGRSSIGAAAYRAGEELSNEITNETHDFTKKSDIADKAILLPNDSPEWMSNREKLWNAVEQAEKRKDAQLAREINIALPKELNESQNWTLLTEFVQKTYVDQGMVADVAFHRGHQGENQPHGHVMLTMREVTPSGFGQKVRAWNNKALLIHWREQWAEYCNVALARHGFDLRIDHRTLEAQGINLEPQTKIGPTAAQASMIRLAEHEALASRNGERLLQDPNIALNALTHQQSTFTHHDIARFVNRHTHTPEQFETVYAKVKAHPDLVLLGLDDQQRERFSTKEMIALEAQMMVHAQAKSLMKEHAVTDSAMQSALATRSLTQEQKTAFFHLMQEGDVVCAVGFAGTGKSYLLGATREAWEAQGYRVQGVTLSGIAAENLESSSGIESHTVANRLWYWEQGRESLTAKDILVVDEAGMLGSRQMARIMSEAERSGAKVVLVGDPEQLQAIEAGASFRAISESVGFVSLTEVRRQTEAWQQEATKDFARHRTHEALHAYQANGNIHSFKDKSQAMTRIVENWNDIRQQSPEKSQLILAYTREDVKTLNEQARDLRHAQGELGQNHLVETARGERVFAEQDRIYFLRNENRDLGVKNGSLGTIEAIEGSQFTVRLDGQDKRVTFYLNQYNDIDHGYAATVHKSQGVTVDRTHVLASSYFDRHSTYVAMTRHREGADLYVDREVFPSMDKLTHTLSQERSKDVTLDYGQERSLPTVASRSPEERPLSDQELRYREAVAKDLDALKKETGLTMSMDPKAGDKGIYRGTVEVAGRRYGVLEKDDQTAKLVRLDLIQSKEKGKEMCIEGQKNARGFETIKAIQPEVKERSRSMGREISF